MATISKKKKKFLKWDCSADFIVDFNTDSDITLLKCKICRKYTAQIRTEAHSRYYVAKFLIASCRMLTT